MTDVDPPARRGRPPVLDADRALDAALQVLEAEGLGAVTFRRLGRELGVSHMTLYGYFDSKDALLEALVARTVRFDAIDRPQDEPWDATLLRAMQGIREELRRRPGVAEVLIAHEVDDRWLRGLREQLLDLLREAGFDDAQATDGISILFNYLLGAVTIESRRGRGGSSDAFGTGLSYLVDGLRTRPPGSGS